MSASFLFKKKKKKVEQTEQTEEAELNDMKVFPVQSFSVYYFRQIILDMKITSLFQSR